MLDISVYYQYHLFKNWSVFDPFAELGFSLVKVDLSGDVDDVILVSNQDHDYLLDTAFFNLGIGTNISIPLASKSDDEKRITFFAKWIYLLGYETLEGIYLKSKNSSNSSRYLIEDIGLPNTRLILGVTYTFGG